MNKWQKKKQYKRKYGENPPKWKKLTLIQVPGDELIQKRQQDNVTTLIIALKRRNIWKRIKSWKR